MWEPRSRVWFLVLLSFLPACASPSPSPTATPAVERHNLDAETQRLIADAERVVFVVPFSHWDTDWHEAFPDYVKRSDGNILAAIRMARQNPRFRYTLEQTLFVQHFWDTYPEYRDDLRRLVHNRQITFAWAGMTQPETSLVAPAVQVRNLELGREWITETFGEAYVPRSAWQSDAFGNSAALPLFLSHLGVPYLFIGRWQGGCNPDRQDCKPLPHAFYWSTPLTPTVRVLVAYVSYPTAWDAIHRIAGVDEQIAVLRQVVESQFERTSSKYAFLPMGSDFIDPMPNLPSLVERWNVEAFRKPGVAGSRTVLVMADPDTAFQYLATQDLPEIVTDLNPIWQAYYGSRPFAKIADKETEYFLTAADKFGLLVDAPPSPAWHTATFSAHYDNIGGVSFDWVWERTQRPRFEQTVTAAADYLAEILADVAGSYSAPVIVFNPTSWPRSEVVEIRAATAADLPDLRGLPEPVQRLGPTHIAFCAESIPPIGFADATHGPVPFTPNHPAGVSQSHDLFTLSNGLVSVSLDPAHGGTFSSLALAGGPELLTSFGDDVTYWDDSGDVYGAFFGEARARESDVPAHITVLAEGPLLARAQVTFALEGQPLTKTVTLRADSPLIEVALEIRALRETTAILHTRTNLVTQDRTDDLGFAAFEHPVDSRHIAPGDITYRRKIFYPVIYWSDVSRREDSRSANGVGLTLVTHGLQGVGGADLLSLMLVRQVSDDGREGVTDPDYHTLHYAYLPHTGGARDLEPEFAAYAFNQPLIPVWRSGEKITVQLPFRDSAITVPGPLSARFAQEIQSFSMLSAQSGIVVDLYRRGDHVEALVLDYDPATPVTIHFGERQIRLTSAALARVPVEIGSMREPH